jgi:hypothetical protein
MGYYGPYDGYGSAASNPSTATLPTTVAQLTKTAATYPVSVVTADGGAALTRTPLCPPPPSCPPCPGCAPPNPCPPCPGPEACPDCPAPEPCPDCPASAPCPDCAECAACNCPECVCADGSDGVLKEAMLTKSKLLIGGSIVAAVLLGVVVGRATKK